jgi:hypothetical protein
MTDCWQCGAVQGQHHAIKLSNLITCSSAHITACLCSNQGALILQSIALKTQLNGSPRITVWSISVVSCAFDTELNLV